MNSIPKILAIYLPQFYETEDNNRWWGKGYTDWKAVKSAESYFDGHVAPWEPLNDNYYDLSDYRVLEQQAILAKKYGIDGFCIYHYYFKDGKKELELPAELLLEHKEIDIEFCFNWANESWIRTWSKISGNAWSEKFEASEVTDKTGILAEQDYGAEKEWKEHFYYLLPFFQDKRYIRIDGKPVFVIYVPQDIKSLDRMMQLWNQLAVEEGIDEIYFIGAGITADMYGVDATVIYEPQKSRKVLNKRGDSVVINGVRCFEYSKIWETVVDGVKQANFQNFKTYFCGVSGYDDTARHGTSGKCFINRTPELFEQGLFQLLCESIRNKNELLFVNAWNEWGEGMYLEPDKKDEYKFLESVKNAKDKVLKANVRYEIRKDKLSVQQTGVWQLRYDLQKNREFVSIYSKWMYLLRKNNIVFSKYFKNYNINSVAIYGMGDLGKQLLEQFRSEGIKCNYGVDKTAGQIGEKFSVIRPESMDWDLVDAVVITAYDENGDIAEKLKNVCNVRIMELGWLIDYIWRDEFKN